jgi:REP element-mobilizing transposase RayT
MLRCMGDPVGYLLTWRTYGTWLHGDSRGAVDRDHNAPGTSLLDANARRVRWERARLKSPPVELDDESRRITEAAIEAHCRFRNWELCAAKARTNHVHAVVSHAGVLPDRMMLELKRRATRRLREAGRYAPTAPIWAERGSRQYLWNSKSLAAAAAYVLDGQDVPH